MELGLYTFADVGPQIDPAQRLRNLLEVAEMAGRGSFIESFPLFGYDLNDYGELFAEKLDLLLKLREAERVTWSGKHRAPLDEAGVYPRPIQDPLPVWIAVGGTPQSVVRAAMLGLPLAIAIIGGQ